MAEYKNLLVEKSERIATVTFNRPKVLNALNAETIDELEAVLRCLENDGEIGGVILTGAGDKAFVAGADIKELSGLDAPSAQASARRGQSVLDRIEHFHVPVVAAVNGFALGGGCELAMACHLRICAENARFGQPEVKLGITPGYGGTQRLARLIGKAKAIELIATGDMIDAQEARQLGLVNSVVKGVELIGECRRLLIKMLGNGPLAIRYALEAINRGYNMPLAEGQSLEATLFGLCFASRDMKEGTRAFLEKRRPNFQGE